MQIVIDIDDEQLLFDIKNRELYGETETEQVILKALYNGTPLPKGHGDLIDFDKLCETYWDGNFMEIHKDDLTNIQTIIKADKE